MTSEGDQKGPVADDVYHVAYDDLNQLHTQLPEDVVAALAQEVLKRVAAQMRDRKADMRSIADLSNALISPDAKEAARLIDARVAAGVAFNEIYLEYLAPAAAVLGKRWERDELTFADVTVGTGRVYAIMRAINRRARPAQPPDKRKALFAMVPGDDHALGLRMAVDLARTQGWDIEPHFDTDHDALVEAIVSSGTHLVGLSAGGIHALPDLARLVLAIRLSAPTARILVSGHIAEVAAEEVKLLHVDAVTNPFQDAMAALTGLWESFQVPAGTEI
ncbi:MAG: cobalamin B12-binding domain-containing protein [Pseudomonadota bacterium]